MGELGERRRFGVEPIGIARTRHPERCAVHHRSVPGAHLRPAPFEDGAGRLGGAARRLGERRARLVAHIGRLRGQPRQVATEHVGEHELASVLDERTPEVPRHRRIVGPGAGRPAHPRQLEGGDRVGDVARTTELERGTESITDRQPEDRADRSLPPGVHARMLAAVSDRPAGPGSGFRMDVLGIALMVVGVDPRHLDPLPRTRPGCVPGPERLGRPHLGAQRVGLRLRLRSMPPRSAPTRRDDRDGDLRSRSPSCCPSPRSSRDPRSGPATASEPTEAHRRRSQPWNVW